MNVRVKESEMSSFTGLSEKEAARRLKEEGYNELPSAKKRSLAEIGFEAMREPMLLLLMACGTVYLLMGERGEALMLLGFVFVVFGITLYQEQKAERALEALRDLSSPRALVIRGGQQKRIAGREVVRGDVVVLHEGDRVPADGVLRSCVNLLVDESLLTGESVPVRKTAAPDVEAMGRPGGEDLPFVFSGSLVVQGQGVAEAKATGLHTEIGRIGKALRSLEPEETTLQKETARLVRHLALVGLALCAGVVVVYGLTWGNWLKGLLAGLTLAMATLPEEFPLVLTIFLALGAWRMSHQQVLTRRVPAIETLGSATVLCVDKTGTLTLNRMEVRKLFARGIALDVDRALREIPEAFHELVEFSVLASQTDPFDPMEKAIRELGERSLGGTEHLHRGWTLVHEYPLARELLALSRVWKSEAGKDYVIAAKGAPEAIADLCHLDPEETERLSCQIASMAEEGLRVLGVAKAGFKPKALPDGQHDFKFEFLGLIGLVDPIREAVPAALRECYAAGIRVIMITGDYPTTARTIARTIGLKGDGRLISGPELDAMGEDELVRSVKEVNLFARVTPEQKLRLVHALKAGGEIVAMTGDGVNDAPALKAAHIGIAMGGRGTDVAREASALVLLDDDFSSIVSAVKMGRRIFDNIRKAIAYIFAIHVPIAAMSLIPVLLKWPLVLQPVHIVFLELIIDPACSVVFEAEPEEADVMRRPPRNPKEPLFGRRTLGMSFLQGIVVLAIVLSVYVVSFRRGHGELEARALTFTTLIVANLGLILTNRSWSRTIWESSRTANRALWWVLAGALVFLGLVLYVPIVRDLFRFSTLHLPDLAICLVAGMTSILWFEGLKVLNGRRKSSRPWACHDGSSKASR